MTGACAANVTFMVVTTHAGFAYENNIGSQMRTAFFSQSLTAISMAVLRSPFLPPSLFTTSIRSRRSTSSESTMYTLPKRVTSLLN